MKITICILALSFIVPSISFSQGGGRKVIRKRQHREERRIRQGVKSGELTKEEAIELQKQQHKIRKARKEALKDGTMTPEERKKITEMENQASQQIYEEKHDEEKRPNDN